MDQLTTIINWTNRNSGFLSLLLLVVTMVGMNVTEGMLTPVTLGIGAGNVSANNI